MQKSATNGSQASGVAVDVRGKGEGVSVGGIVVDVGEGIAIVAVVVGSGSGV
jgi:hypothetical protein